MRFDPRSNNFGDDFIFYFAKANGSEVPEIGCIEALRNKAKVSSVHLLFYSTGLKSILAEFNSLGSHYIPISLEEKGLDTIKARCLSRLEGEDSLFDFFWNRNGV